MKKPVIVVAIIIQGKRIASKQLIMTEPDLDFHFVSKCLAVSKSKVSLTCSSYLDY